MLFFVLHNYLEIMEFLYKTKLLTPLYKKKDLFFFYFRCFNFIHIYIYKCKHLIYIFFFIYESAWLEKIGHIFPWAWEDTSYFLWHNSMAMKKDDVYPHRYHKIHSRSGMRVKGDSTKGRAKRGIEEPEQPNDDHIRVLDKFHNRKVLSQVRCNGIKYIAHRWHMRLLRSHFSLCLEHMDKNLVHYFHLSMLPTTQIKFQH